MGWIIDYIRSCFCKHQWKLIEDSLVYKNSYTVCRLELAEPIFAKSALDGK